MNGVSKSILKFKAGVAFHIATWAEVAKVALLEAGLQREDILDRALVQQQTAVLWRSEPRPMDVLCRSIAVPTGCAYVGGLLRRQRQNAKVTGLRGAPRIHTLENTYELAPVFGWGKKRVWIKADVVH